MEGAIAQSVLHRVEQFFENDNTLNGYCVVSGEGRFLRVNRRCCEVLGYTEEQLLGLTFQEITHPQDLKPDVNQFRKVLSGEITRYTMEKRYIHGQTNADIWAVLNVQGYYSETGEFDFFLSEIAEVSDRRLSTEERYQLQQIKTGIENKEFQLYYQPIVQLEAGVVVGFEALARWLHDGTVLSPYKFIPLLQASHNIHLLCHAMIEAAADIIDKFHDYGYWLSVNVSPLTIIRDDWPKYAQKLGQHTHMEILEDAAANAQLVERLQELSDRGVHLALDDFGTGYSTFKALQEYKVKTLKVDASLVRGLPEKEYIAMCAAITAMAAALDLSVVAEGIETELQATEARKLGCEYGQGYYWAKPMPLEQALNFSL